MKSFLFVLGLSTCFILLGFGAGAFGSVINQPFFNVLLGIIVIILGIHQMGIIHIPWLYYEKKIHVEQSQKSGYFSPFLLGLTFSFGWTPCIGPILGTILSLSISSSESIYGGVLMAVYSLGFLIPFLVIALFSDTLILKVKIINRYLDKIKVIGGVIIILMGLLLMSGQLNRLTEIFG